MPIELTAHTDAGARLVAIAEELSGGPRGPRGQARPRRQLPVRGIDALKARRLLRRAHPGRLGGLGVTSAPRPGGGVEPPGARRCLGRDRRQHAPRRGAQHGAPPPGRGRGRGDARGALRPRARSDRQRGSRPRGSDQRARAGPHPAGDDATRTSRVGGSTGGRLLHHVPRRDDLYAAVTYATTTASSADVRQQITKRLKELKPLVGYHQLEGMVRKFATGDGVSRPPGRSSTRARPRAAPTRAAAGVLAGAVPARLRDWPLLRPSPESPFPRWPRRWESLPTTSTGFFPSSPRTEKSKRAAPAGSPLPGSHSTSLGARRTCPAGKPSTAGRFPDLRLGRLSAWACGSRTPALAGQAASATPRMRRTEVVQLDTDVEVASDFRNFRPSSTHGNRFGTGGRTAVGGRPNRKTPASGLATANPSGTLSGHDWEGRNRMIVRTEARAQTLAGTHFEGDGRLTSQRTQAGNLITRRQRHSGRAAADPRDPGR